MHRRRRNKICASIFQVVKPLHVDFGKAGGSFSTVPALLPEVRASASDQFKGKKNVSFDEAPVEHLTFMFGIFMLISMVAICTLFLMKLTKASADSSRRGLGGILPSNCSMVLWMPKSDAHRHHLHHHRHRVAAPTAAVHQQQQQHYHRRPSSLMILLRSSFSCGAGTTAAGGVPKHRRARNAGPTVRAGRSCISVVSSSSLNPLLPPHSLAIITPSPSSSASAGGGFIGCSADDGARGVNSATIKNCAPPPPYDDALAQTKATA
ncbi:hypothetical protein GPALN_011704 [Globodera pallida]|nr:hypothetical protein GPALN_011704 [Globodera pallida]